MQLPEDLEAEAATTLDERKQVVCELEGHMNRAWSARSSEKA